MAKDRLEGRFNATILYKIDVRGKRTKQGSGPNPSVFTPEAYKAFLEWQLDNDCFPARRTGGWSGMGRGISYWYPEDAHKAIEWLKSQGLKEITP